jgi:hypothetical protein
MASKLAVAGIIEGNFTDEGLAAMSDCADMTTALARELTAGIKNEVEDLSAVFKKMAILKPAAEQLAIEAAAEDITVADTVAVTDVDDSYHSDDTPVIPVYQIYPVRSARIIDDTIEVAAYTTDAPAPLSGLLSFVNHTKPARATRRSIVFADDISLDVLEAAA